MNIRGIQKRQMEREYLIRIITGPIPTSLRIVSEFQQIGISRRLRSVAEELCTSGTFEPARVRHNNASLQTISARLPAHIKQPAPLTDFSQYDSSPSRRAYCYAELVVSFSGMAETTASTHCTSSQDVRLSRPEFTNPTSNRAQRSFTLLM